MSVRGLHLEAGVTPDPWLLRAAVEDYVVTDVRPDASDDGTPLDACWTLWLDCGTGPERASDRRTMLAQMGRYGHQQILGWDDVELPEFFLQYRALMKIVADESDVQHAIET